VDALSSPLRKDSKTKLNNQFSIDYDSVYLRPAYIINVEQFLGEVTPSRAIVYWLEEYVHLERLKTVQDIVSAIQESISLIDNMINDMLNSIIHHPNLQKLEASWRGLDYMVKQATEAKNIKIKLLDISWAEVVKDISRAIEFDQSQLFQKIYSEEYGTPGGEPYGAIIGDYEIHHKPNANHPFDDLSTLEGLAEVAAAAFTPFIAGVSSDFFGIEDYSTLGQPLNFEAIFDQTEYIKWRSLRDKVDSRFVGLTLPRMLIRKPYRTKPGSYKGLFFYEKNQGHKKNYLWSNACYAFGALLIREFNNVGWFGHIRGVPRNHLGGGLITNLPVDSFSTDDSAVSYKPITEVIVTDTKERELSDLGFIPLCQCYDLPFVSFYSNQSIQKPKKQNTEEANINAKLSAMMQHILCASRIAHYIKVIIRDKVGSFMSALDCERYLANWLYKYTTGREDLDWEEQARYPLRDAHVKVNEHPEKPGQYFCSIYLRPHYQLDQMISELELTTELIQKN